jgi:hypothetical protein
MDGVSHANTGLPRLFIECFHLLEAQLVSEHFIASLPFYRFVTDCNIPAASTITGGAQSRDDGGF